MEGPASPSGDIVGTNDAQTLTNKTIAAGSNSVSGLSVSMFAGTAIVTEAEGIASNDNDTSLPTSAAVKDYVDSAGSTAAASQGQMEAASSTSVFTSPGRQHFHPSACKFWLKANGDSASIEGSYNVSGTVDNGTGDLTVLLDTDFSSDDWCVQLTNEVDGDFDPNLHGIDSGNLLAGSVRCWTSDFDPGHWYVCGFGDQ